MFNKKVKTVSGVCDQFTAELERIKVAQNEAETAAQNTAKELEKELKDVEAKAMKHQKEATNAQTAIDNIKGLFGFTVESDNSVGDIPSKED